jgi:tRNA-dihydrouridine synthase
MTGCDGIMLGRGVQGKPWLFEQINDYLAKGTYKEEPGIEERIRLIEQQLQWMTEYKSEHIAVLEMRKHSSWYLKGIKNSSSIRAQINKASTKEELSAMLRTLL